MGMNEKVYPVHIYEPIRWKIGVSYVQHELRKYLPSLRDKDAWKKIDGDINLWFEKAPFLMPVRDFWNGVHGIMMGFKLYNQLLNFITAENVIWTKEEIELDKLTFGTVNPLVRQILEEGSEVSSAIQAYKSNEALRRQHLEELGKWYEMTEKRENHPIIVTQKEVDGVDRLIIYDGNGRATRKLLMGEEKISAYVGRFKGQGRKPENYWLPTSLLMEVTDLAKFAWKKEKKDLYLNYVVVLKDMMSKSESGKYEEKERVIQGNEFGAQLRKDLDLV